jgi:S1-C subfamily serine protease
MADQLNSLEQFSNALAACVEATKSIIAAVRLAGGHHITGIAWGPDAIVTSEQSLPKQDELEVVLAGGSVVTTKAAGRDPSTNIAILRTSVPKASPSIATSKPRTGEIAIATGADGSGGATARLGVVNIAGPAWHSNQGGLIDQRIVLDIRLARHEEGGPVFDAAGACIGMSTFGVRGQILVIPTATIERIVPALLKDGRVARGWIGVALQPVAVPDALRGIANQSTGLMVMSVAKDGPAAQAGIVAGDIVLSVDGNATHRFRKITRHLGADSIGRKADLRLIRSGGVISVQTSIAERPPG